MPSPQNGLPLVGPSIRFRLYPIQQTLHGVPPILHGIDLNYTAPVVRQPAMATELVNTNWRFVLPQPSKALRPVTNVGDDKASDAMREQMAKRACPM
jgi:hypothetical protein